LIAPLNDDTTVTSSIADIPGTGTVRLLQPISREATVRDRRHPGGLVLLSRSVRNAANSTPVRQWRRRRQPVLRHTAHVNPLHQDTTRPVLDPDGTLAKPIGNSTPVVLSDAVPMRQDQLAPSTTYRSPGFEYLTDEHALPARVRGALRIVPRAQRVRHPGTQRGVGHLGSGTHGGHIVAVSLGGFASGPNLFPQLRNFNVSAYARLERGWRAALGDGPRGHHPQVVAVPDEMVRIGGRPNNTWPRGDPGARYRRLSDD
jgi:hypothetical protein